VEVWDEGLATLEGDAYDGALDVGGGEGRKVVEVGDGDLEVGGVDLCATGELDAARRPLRTAPAVLRPRLGMEASEVVRRAARARRDRMLVRAIGGGGGAGGRMGCDRGLG